MDKKRSDFADTIQLLILVTGAVFIMFFLSQCHIKEKEAYYQFKEKEMGKLNEN